MSFALSNNFAAYNGTTNHYVFPPVWPYTVQRRWPVLISTVGRDLVRRPGLSPRLHRGVSDRVWPCHIDSRRDGKRVSSCVGESLRQTGVDGGGWMIEKHGSLLTFLRYHYRGMLFFDR
jgi:hypothetical protein